MFAQLNLKNLSPIFYDYYLFFFYYQLLCIINEKIHHKWRLITSNNSVEGHQAWAPGFGDFCPIWRIDPYTCTVRRWMRESKHKPAPILSLLIKN
jgi:hypothetical protein